MATKCKHQRHFHHKFTSTIYFVIGPHDRFVLLRTPKLGVLISLVTVFIRVQFVFFAKSFKYIEQKSLKNEFIVRHNIIASGN